jgi:hypothetical protein
MSLSDLSAKWNPKNLEIKTRSVEKTLEPLVIQVYKNTFINPPPLPPALRPDPSLVKQGLGLPQSGSFIWHEIL